MTPTPQQIKQTRLTAGLSQVQAAQMVGLSVRQWKYFESGEQEMKSVYWFAFKQMIEGIKEKIDETHAPTED